MNKTGFTFLELILVLLLISVIIVLAVPRVRSTFTNLEVESLAKRVAALMRYAQSKAIAEGEKIYLIYEYSQSDKDRKFSLKKDDLSSPPEEKKKITIDERYQLSVPHKIAIQMNSNEIIFNSDGSIEGPQIEVSNEMRRFQITAKAGIGRVEVNQIRE